jgi:general secretion pathway protein D
VNNRSGLAALRFPGALGLLVLLLAGCAPEPLRVGTPAIMSKVAAGKEQGSATNTDAAVLDPTGRAGQDSGLIPGTLTTIPSLEREVKIAPVADASLRFANNDKISVAADAMPLKNFLNYVFGELLKVNFIIAEGAGILDQSVTLSTQGPVSSRQLYRLTIELIGSKGLALTEKEGVLLISPVSGKGAGDVVIGFGRAETDVPQTSGRILQIVPWRFGQNLAVEALIRELVDVSTRPADQQNALFLSGTRPAILRALELLRMLDQPAARGGRIGLLSFTYVDPKEFVKQASILLENEGISAGEGRAEGKSVAFVPLDRRGSVVIFAASPEVLNRVEFWAKQIDLPDRGPTSRYFVFQPKYARASDLLASLSPLLGQGQSAGAQGGNQSRDTRSALVGSGGQSTLESSVVRDRANGGQAAPVSVSSTDLTITADPSTNSLILYTTGLRYEALLPMIRRLDVPPKQILLEATIAEVSLSGDFANGVEFAFRDGKLSGGTAGSFALPSSGIGLTYLGNVTDSVRMRLQANDSRVNVLSSPIIMVRDGSAASIAVGNDVPILGSRVSEPTQSNRTVVSVAYRQTGIKLSITPTVNAERSVLMLITQDISNSVPGASGVEGAPAFFSRSLSTEVVAQSGQTVLLAGLISESDNRSSNGVPFLRKLPGIGAAFRSDSTKREKTELVLLLTARILEGPDEVSGVMGDLRGALELLDLGKLDTVTTSKSQGEPK